MNAVKSFFFLSLLTVILSFSYHVSGVVTIFGAFCHSLLCISFVLKTAAAGEESKAEQNHCHGSNFEESNFINRSLEFTSSNLMF